MESYSSLTLSKKAYQHHSIYGAYFILLIVKLEDHSQLHIIYRMCRSLLSKTKDGIFKNIYCSLLVIGPLWSWQMMKNWKLSSVSGRNFNYGTITSWNLRFIVVRFRLGQGRWRWWDSEEKCIEHANDLTKAWSQVWIFNPTWLYDKGKIRGYIFWKARPLMLQFQI